MIKQNEIKMKLKSPSWPMYMEEICIIQIQRPSRAGALGPIFVIIFFNARVPIPCNSQEFLFFIASSVQWTSQQL
jgi:hypothetical protein